MSEYERRMIDVLITTGRILYWIFKIREKF